MNQIKPYQSNRWPALPRGLYEVHGNVRKWCRDWYGDYPAHSIVDPEGSKQGEARVLRGGGTTSPGGRVPRSASGASPAVASILPVSALPEVNPPTPEGLSNRDPEPRPFGRSEVQSVEVRRNRPQIRIGSIRPDSAHNATTSKEST